MLHRIRPLLLLLLALPALHAAHADPRFQEVPSFWDDGAEITLEVLERDEWDGEVTLLRLSWPAPRAGALHHELEIRRDGEWLQSVPRGTHTVDVAYENTDEGTWTVQPILNVLRPIGEPLSRVVKAPPPPSAPPRMPFDEGDVSPSGVLVEAFGVGDTALPVLEGNPTGADLERILLQPGFESSLHSTDDLSGLEDLGIGTDGPTRSGMRSLDNAAPPGTHGRAAGTAGHGSLGVARMEPAALYRFFATEEHVTLGGPSPPHPEEVSHVIAHTRHEALRACARSLTTHPAVTWEVRITAPPGVAVEVIARASSGEAPSAFVTCVEDVLRTAPWPEPAYGWQATVRVHSGTGPP